MKSASLAVLIASASLSAATTAAPIVIPEPTLEYQGYSNPYTPPSNAFFTNSFSKELTVTQSSAEQVSSRLYVNGIRDFRLQFTLTDAAGNIWSGYRFFFANNAFLQFPNELTYTQQYGSVPDFTITRAGSNQFGTVTSVITGGLLEVTFGNRTAPANSEPLRFEFDISAPLNDSGFRTMGIAQAAITATPTVPEPSALVMALAGLGCVAAMPVLRGRRA